MYRDLAHCTVAYLEGFLPVREGGGVAEIGSSLLSPGMATAGQNLRQTVERAIGRPVQRRHVLHGTEVARRLEDEIRWHIFENPQFGRRIRSTVVLNGVFNLVLADGKLYDPTLLASSERPASLGPVPSRPATNASAR